MAFDPHRNLFVQNGAWAARALRIGQALHAVFGKALAPRANRMRAMTGTGGNRLAR
jgi:hypothetical protein